MPRGMNFKNKKLKNNIKAKRDENDKARYTHYGTNH